MRLNVAQNMKNINGEDLLEPKDGQALVVTLRAVLVTALMDPLDTDTGIVKAEKYGLAMNYPTVSFRLRGKTAGTANYGKQEIRYNAVLLEENGDNFLGRTVPHEVAHLVTRQKYGNRASAHGYEWKSVMRAFGLNPTRCHSYDVSNSTVKTVKRGFEYKCSCRTYDLTVIRHKRIMKGAKYTCRSCKTTLTAV